MIFFRKPVPLFWIMLKLKQPKPAPQLNETCHNTHHAQGLHDVAHDPAPLTLTQPIQQLDRAEPHGESSQEKSGKNDQATIGADSENCKDRAYGEQIFGMRYARCEPYQKCEARAHVDPFLLTALVLLGQSQYGAAVYDVQKRDPA